MANQPKTLFQKIWDSHVVTEQEGAPAVLYIDLHLVHEVTSPQAFTGLRQRGLKIRRPDKTLATMDHSIPTTPIDGPIADAMAAAQIKQMETNAAEFGITLHGSNDRFAQDSNITQTIGQLFARGGLKVNGRSSRQIRPAFSVR